MAEAQETATLNFENAETEDAEIARMMREESGEPEPAPEEPAPDPQAEPAEPEPEPEPDPEEPKQEQHTVPASVVADLRRERNELRGELGTLKQEMQELLKAVRAGKEPAEQPEAVPSLEDSPVEYLAHQSKQAIDEVNSLKEMLHKQQTEAQQKAAQDKIVDIERSFAQETPDYYKAEQFVRQRRVEQYKNYFGLSEEQALQKYGEESGMFIQAQTQQGRNFAEALYELAKNEGFEAQPAPQEEAKAKPKVDPEATLKDTARKLQQSRSLQGASGKSGKGEEMSPEDVNALSDDEFDKMFTGEAGTERLRKIMGG